MISGQQVTVDQLGEKHGDMIPSGNPRRRWAFTIRAAKLKGARELRVSNYLADNSRNRLLYGNGGHQKGKRPDSAGKPTWVTEATIGGKKTNLCMMYQNNTCQRGDQCRFGHFCAYPLANGQACGQKHSAFSHQQQSH